MSDDSGRTDNDRLGGMFQRIFSDPDFVTSLEQDPERALRDAGFELDEEAAAELNRLRSEGAVPSTMDANVLPFVAVRVYTSPGTNPVVQVVTYTRVPFPKQQEFAERLKAVEDAAQDETEGEDGQDET